jgi:hypothetical protein
MIPPLDDKTPPSNQHQWERGWDDHEQQQLQRLARLSLPEKLKWLEEAHRLVRQIAAREAPGDNPKK